MRKYILCVLCIIVGAPEIQSQTDWQFLNPRPTANNGNAIKFVSSNLGYIITSKEILETSDGGVLWQKKQDIASGNDMSFYNNLGFIVGDGGYVLRSEDTGNTWTQISTGVNVAFNTVNIIDADNIILSTRNKIVKSTDGGNTWITRNIPCEMVKKTFFINPLVGHAVCQSGTALKTIDGGQNWYTTMDLGNTYVESASIYFVNEDIGFLAFDHRGLYKTINGGEAWTVVSQQISTPIYSFHFLNPTIGFAAGRDGAMYKTSDGGNTWNWIGFEEEGNNNNTISGIYFLDNNIGYATGWRGRILKTTNGGISWLAHSPTYEDIHVMQFLNNNLGYVKAGSKLFKTIDGGNNWNFVSSFILDYYTSISFFSFIDENIGYAISGEHVYKTNNGGVNWTATNNGNSVINGGINSLYFIDANNGFVTGGFNSYKLKKTTDGGLTWTFVQPLRFGTIQFPTNLIGYGDGGSTTNSGLYKTIDGGNNWENIFPLTGFGNNVKSFHFVDENNGYFITEIGLMKKTTDGGVTWSDFSPAGLSYDGKIRFMSPTFGYLLLDSGALYKTMSSGDHWSLVTSKNVNSLYFSEDHIFLTGTTGRIYKSDIEYNPVGLTIFQIANITRSSVDLSGMVTAYAEPVTGIQFEYSTDQSFENFIPTSRDTLWAGQADSFTNTLQNLLSDTNYYARLKATHDSIDYVSSFVNFRTLPGYSMITNPVEYFSSNTAEVRGSIITYENDIIDIVFEYGTEIDELNNSVIGTPSFVESNTTESIMGILGNLEPNTQYFYRLKGLHQGVEIFGNIESFSTHPLSIINLLSPEGTGEEVNLSAHIQNFDIEMTDITFQYGTTLDYENEILASPSQIEPNNSTFVYASLIDLNPEIIYYFRVRAQQNGETIYSEEVVFRESGGIIIVAGTILPQNEDLEFRGLINPSGYSLSDIHFEYGITQELGSLIAGSPPEAFGYDTTLVTGLLMDALPNETYYYRIGAIHDGLMVYSDIYQYRTGPLNLDGLDDKSWSIFPNPTSDVVNIKFKNPEIINSISICDMSGKLLYKINKRNITDNLKIDLSNYAMGMYLMKVQFDNHKTISAKLLVK